MCLKENAAIREAEEKAQRAREAKEAREREKQEAKDALEKKTNPVGGSGGGDADQKGVVDELLSQLNSGAVFKQRERKKRNPKPGGDDRSKRSTRLVRSAPPGLGCQSRDSVWGRVRCSVTRQADLAEKPDLATIAIAVKKGGSGIPAVQSVAGGEGPCRIAVPKTKYRGERLQSRERI